MNDHEQRLSEQLNQLRLSFFQEHYQELADQGAREQWNPLQYLARLVEGESQRRYERHIARRLAAARFPVIKTLEQFNWNWPKKINRPKSKTSSAWPSSKTRPAWCSWEELG